MLNTNSTLSPTLRCLVNDIDRAMHISPDSMPAAVKEALCKRSHLQTMLSEAQQQGSRTNYKRHLLYEDPMGRFSILSLVWEPGQKTPIHGHYTWCAYTILKGTMSEEQFVWSTGCENPTFLKCVSLISQQGAASHAGIDMMHCLANNGDEKAISIHVYGVEGQRVSTHVNRLPKN